MFKMFERNVSVDDGYITVIVRKGVITLNGCVITTEQAKRISDALLDAEYMIQEEKSND